MGAGRRLGTAAPTNGVGKGWALAAGGAECPLGHAALGDRVPPLWSWSIISHRETLPSEALQVLPDGFLKLRYSAEITENVDS